MSDHLAIEAARIRAAISRRLRGVMLLADVSRSGLSAQTGISETRIARVMKGSSDLSAVELVIISRALAVPIDALCAEDAKRPPRRN